MDERFKEIISGKNFQDIINEKEFYFQKAQDILNAWLELDLSENTKIELLNIAHDYEKFQALSITHSEIKVVLKMLFEIISYCDSKAKDKSIYNQYEDNRSLAMASVRMNTWVEKLINLKLKPENIGTGSAKNAFDYLIDPLKGITILSENHRELIAQNLLKKIYNPLTFVQDVKDYFEGYKLKVSNGNNYTQLLSVLTYVIQNDWKEEVIALMASDGGNWQEDRIEELKINNASILWNSKRPSGTSATIKFLRNIIAEGNTFNLWYSSKGVVNYKARVIDFAESQQELDEGKWDLRFSEISQYEENFENYVNDNLKAKILFLVDRVEKTPSISVSEFKFYNGYSSPRQDNLSPIKLEPEIDLSIKISTPTLIDTFMQSNNYPLNQILFGPPGTGKTYNTINKALEITGENIEGKTRGEIKDLYNAKMKDRQIIFSTFHQSMSYEDFIEGIKPLKPLPNDTFVKYDVLPGIFYTICETAKSNYENSKVENKGKLNFEDAFELFTEEWGQNLEMKFPLKTEGYDFTIIGFTTTSIQFKKANGGTSHTLSIGTLRELYYGKDFNFKQGVGIYYPAVLKKVQSYQAGKLDEVMLKNYVLIIDEINRGNVSQIFGELITLIETDKRLGNYEALEVTLPYSKEKFGVPPNLYIIGTMNTADRSVEALDTALRRRFSFEEMPPKYNLDQLQYTYAEINVSNLLKTINQRIEKLLDKDHAIGHSYFLLQAGEKAEDKMPIIFYKNIIPLLQEYFFGDFGKIGLVLGNGFICKKSWNKADSSFAEFDAESAVDFDERDVYEIINYFNVVTPYTLEINKKIITMDFDKAVKLLMNQIIE